MSNVIEKLNSYQIMTNLLPGALFGIALRFFLNLPLPTQNVGEEIVVYYFIGLIINRIGSLIVKPFLKRIHFIKEEPYSDYIEATKIDAKIDTLSETNNHFRSILTCFLLLPIVWTLKVLILNKEWFSQNWKGFLILFLIVLFLFAFRSQTNYIRNRVKTARVTLTKTAIDTEKDINKKIM